MQAFRLRMLNGRHPMHGQNRLARQLLKTDGLLDRSIGFVVLKL